MEENEEIDIDEAQEIVFELVRKVQILVACCIVGFSVFMLSASGSFLMKLLGMVIVAFPVLSKGWNGGFGEVFNFTITKTRYGTSEKIQDASSEMSMKLFLALMVLFIGILLVPVKVTVMVMQYIYYKKKFNLPNPNIINSMVLPIIVGIIAFFVIMTVSNYQSKKEMEKFLKSDANEKETLIILQNVKNTTEDADFSYYFLDNIYDGNMISVNVSKNKNNPEYTVRVSSSNSSVYVANPHTLPLGTYKVLNGEITDYVYDGMVYFKDIPLVDFNDDKIKSAIMGYVFPEIVKLDYMIADLGKVKIKEYDNKTINYISLRIDDKENAIDIFADVKSNKIKYAYNRKFIYSKYNKLNCTSDCEGKIYSGDNKINFIYK